jgi:hypothetical protein
MISARICIAVVLLLDADRMNSGTSRVDKQVAELFGPLLILSSRKNEWKICGAAADSGGCSGRSMFRL